MLPSNDSANSQDAIAAKKSRLPFPHKSFDDMNDALDLERYEGDISSGYDELEPLRSAIRVVQEKIHPTFAKFDRAAVRYHDWYKYISVGAVFFGAASVFFAVTEVMALRLPGDLSAALLELITVSLTLLCITAGLAMKLKESWILSRYKAENLRLLKFRKLTDPQMWCDPPDLRKSASDLERDVREIASQNYEDAKEWAANGVHPHIAQPPCSNRCQPALHELVDYYIPKRLDVQIRYLERKSVSVERLGTWTSMAVQLFFWLSFAFVMCHVVVSRVPREGAVHTGASISAPAVESTAKGSIQNQIPLERASHDPKLEDWLALFALFLPIIAASIRTYRAANEFERTALRHRATLDSLIDLSDKLKETKDLDKKFELVGFCELVLEADCREFLRLVSEAEWYG